ncbi:hypothetical protein [Massilia sp. TSP1-1-2]|uniref:hypothetical protein n=1 Tax=Massilia sp. TSP1-1-2 TaxID=2804649 RepID=UPI003CFAE48A
MSEARRLRRRRINYLLASESTEIFNRMVGKSVLKIKFGMPANRNCSVRDVGNLAEALIDCYGGPFFITYEGGHTVVLYDDDFLGSIVVREIARDVDEKDFFDVLESEDRLGERAKIQKSVDLMPAEHEPGKIIESISVWKLPDNFHVIPAAYDLVCECIVTLTIAGIGEIVFASHIKEAEKAMDIRISRWEWLDQFEVKKLTCIWTAKV